jgi:hypothetical protein
MSIGLTYDEVTNSTRIVIRIANLQGSGDYLPNPGAYGIRDFRFENLVATGGTGFVRGSAVVTGIGNTSETLLADKGGFYESDAPGGDGWIWIGPGAIGGHTELYGCDLPDPRGFHGGWTCGGAFEFDFSLAGRWELTDATVASFGGIQYEGAPAPHDPTGCTTAAVDGSTGSGFFHPGPCATAVPEPFTIALLGSGLAAMGGVGALRRRRKNL